MKILVFDATPIARTVYSESLSGHELVFHDGPVTDDVIVANTDAEVISLFVSSKLTAAQMDMMPSLKMISARSAGFDHIDHAHAKERGIAVSRVPKYGQHTVAEFTLGLMLQLSRKLYEASRRVREECSFSQDGLEGFDLFGKTLGVLGTGNIGRAVVGLAQGFGMEVLMYDVAPAVGLENAHAKYVELDVLLSRADIISIHVPFLPENRHFLNADRIAKMKQGAYVINTARGELVDTDALLAALKDGKLGGAGLDVLEEERVLKLCRGHMEGLTPEEAAMVSADKTLMDMPNVIITPHVAYFSREANRDIQEISAGNVTAFINGAPTNVLA